MKKRMLLVFLCLIAVIGLTYGAKYLYDFKVYQSITSTLTISDIDLSKVKDGAYIGECDAKLVEAKTKVTVENGKIINLELLEHKNERGKDAEGILSKVISEQSLDVDVISGATNSSKVILKSIENAFKE
jgi:uncharacterized protein with FMN-binding domain